MTHKVYLESLGCAKNQVDAEVMLNILKKKGYIHVENIEDADLIIINTCGFIESAKEESLKALFELRGANPEAKLVFSGCLTQRYSDVLELPEADAIFGNRDLKQISTVVDELFDEHIDEQIVLAPEYPDPDDDAYQRDELLNFKGSAYLKLSEGCNHCCAYCAIPVIRGPLRSRPQKQIVAEAESLAKRGIREINVIAQDLAAWGTDFDGNSHLLELLEVLCNIEGDFKLRLLYIHPDAFPLELIDFVKTHDKVLPYFDIPFQHASANVLSKMGRVGNEESYYQLVKSIRDQIPEAVIRTTIMLGFPGETDEDFEIVMKFVERCRFDWMGSFLYSREEDTVAYDMRDEEEHNEAHKRAAKYQLRLQDLQERITSELLEEKFVGNVYDVLIEEKIEGEDLAIGRIYSQAPEVDGATVVMGRNLQPGAVVKAGIRKVNGVDLDAAVLGDYNG
ncbi:MAG: 30S ribosomal protein S12 methylthiotransferase RimO [Sphaerochaetaceae bacterium]